MKSLCFSLALCATLAGGSAAAADPWSAPNFNHPSQSSSVMLYVHKYIGSKNRKLTAPTFGLSIEKHSAFSLHENPLLLSPGSMRVFDLRLSTANLRSIRLNGVKFNLRSGFTDDEGDDSYGDDSYGEDSIGGESWDNPVLWLSAVVATAGVACLSHVVICKKSERSPPPPPPSTYTPPTG